MSTIYGAATVLCNICKTLWVASELAVQFCVSSTDGDHLRCVCHDAIAPTTMTTTVLRPFFRDHLALPVPEQKFFWSLWCYGAFWRGRHTQQSRLAPLHPDSSAIHLHQCPHFYARSPSCHNPPNLSWLGTCTHAQEYAGLHIPMVWFCYSSN